MGDNDSRQADDKYGGVTIGLNGRTTLSVSVASSQASKSSRWPDYDFGENDTPKSRQNERNKNKDNKKNRTKNKMGKKKKDEKNKETDETAVASHEPNEQARTKDIKPKTFALNFFPNKKAVNKRNEIKKNKQSDDEERPKEKCTKVKVVIVDDEVIPTQNRIGSRKEPLMYGYWYYRSLRDGTVIGGIVFAILCIAYLVVRVKEFQIRALLGVWNGVHLLPDVWRVLLIFGFITASLCLTASLLLVVASCLCEKYSKIRLVISFWFVASVASLINNVGELVFIEAMPEVNLWAYHPSDSIMDIKSNSRQLRVLIGHFAVVFMFISPILVLYLRLLKYMDSPNIVITWLNQENDKIGGGEPVGRADSAKLENATGERIVRNESSLEYRHLPV